MRKLGIFAFAAVMFGGILFTAVYAGWSWVPFKRKRRRKEIIRDIQGLHEVALNILENSPEKLDYALERSFQRYVRHTLLLEGITPDDLSISGIRDATNYVINDVVYGHFTEANIRTLHAHIMKHDEPTIAGQFRQIDVYVPVPRTSIFQKSRIFVAPRHAEVPKLIHELINWFNEQQLATFENQLIFAAEAKLKLVTIHPFEDGNGRASRALLAGLLCKIRGFPFVTIPVNTKQEYFSALHEAEETGSSEAFIEFCLRMIEQSFKSFVEDLFQST